MSTACHLEEGVTSRLAARRSRAARKALVWRTHELSFSIELEYDNEY